MSNALRLAVIADVHGNALALDAVLADIGRRGISSIVNLGDNANGPLEPARSVALLRASGARHVRGNGDRMVGEGGEDITRSARFAREQIGESEATWLRELPLTTSGDDWWACHGSPESDVGYLVETVTPSGARPATVSEIQARLGKISARLILCGHTHVARRIGLPDGRLVVNPGSVGLPAYEDRAPWPHVMESGTPQACYAIAERTNEGWRAELIAVDYDWHRAAAQARAAGWEAWARTLETGRV